MFQLSYLLYVNPLYRNVNVGQCSRTMMYNASIISSPLLKIDQKQTIQNYVLCQVLKLSNLLSFCSAIKTHEGWMTGLIFKIAESVSSKIPVFSILERIFDNNDLDILAVTYPATLP